MDWDRVFTNINQAEELLKVGALNEKEYGMLVRKFLGLNPELPKAYLAYLVKSQKGLER